MVVAFTVLLAGLFGMIFVAYANTPLPVATQQDAVKQGSIIYYRDGKTEIARLGTKREIVSIDKIPMHVQDAVIAAENRTFREDSGISVPAIARSVWMTATGQQVQGASTITQQMARNYFDGLSQEVSAKRKIKEIFVAIRADREMTKDQILANYLNTIYFGRGAYGIQAAAQAFFDKDVDKLTPAEGAYLAGRIQNPDAFDKAEAAKNWAPTKERFSYVIGGMATIKPAEYGKLPAEAKFPKLAKQNKTEVYKGINGYMIDIVERELAANLKISKEDLKSGGYRITSTFDKKLMLAAKQAVESNLKTVGDKNIRANMAAVDPSNGRVTAFYSGHDFLDKKRGFTNNAFDAYKQAASAFKPYVLAAWLEAGYSLKSYVLGKGPVTLPGTKPIRNSHNVGDAVRIDTATAESVNTAFATMAQEVGLPAVLRIAEDAGINKKNLEQAEHDHQYALSIGSGLVTPVEQASGYGMFINGGKHYTPHVVISVKDVKGTTFFRESAPGKDVISPDTAADATYAMQQVVKSGTAAGLSLPGRPIAGKTGTNNENKDAWFVGFTPQLSTAVGMYKEVPKIDPKTKKVMKDANGYPLSEEVTLGSIQGADTPTKIWHDFMAIAMANKPVEQLPQPAFAGQEHDLVSKPAPTPTPDPFNNNGDNVTNDPACIPGDATCTSNPGNGGFNGSDDPSGGGSGGDPFGDANPDGSGNGTLGGG